MFTKEEIIRELQRCAKENGGKTPSEKKFYENSEVIRYDRMKYWPNYGELVHEAGLIPNNFDKTKYSYEQLCEMFIEVIRDNGKWPTRGILDVKHHNDSDFPNSATFFNKLGLTKDLARTILKFIEDKDEFKDVVEICNSVLKKSTGQDKDSESQDVTSGFVYLGEQHGNYKIGKTRDINRRREDISLLGAEPFNLVYAIKTDDIDGVEKYWHNRFSTKRKRGEWFNLSRVDVKAFKRWKKIY